LISMNWKLPIAAVAAIPAFALTLVPSAAVADNGAHSGHDLIRADLTPSMPTDDPIDGVGPGGLPWIIDRGEVRVRTDGRMDVRIDGLQVPRDDGSADNPVGMVDAVLYCAGAPVADSGPQPLSIPEGDARFRVLLDVPPTCAAASVLISPSAAVGTAYIASAVSD
jgi:hypothetical protein